MIDNNMLILAILVFVYGLAIGSFLNVIIYRVPLEQSIVKPRSQCPQCGHQITAKENIPILSYLLLRGKCSSCGMHISLRYPSVELLTALLLTLLFYVLGPNWQFVGMAYFTILIIAITFIDMDHYIIPNGLLLLGIFALLPLYFGQGVTMLIPALIGAFSLGLGFYIIGFLGEKVFKKESLGMGDVKYAFVIGLILGWKAGIVAVAMTFLGASVFILALLPFGKLEIGQKIPFGPFMGFGTFISILCYQDIIDWYIRVAF
jgi:leader peptidase (prepilin peptidase) / N-methyltransferase